MDIIQYIGAFFIAHIVGSVNGVGDRKTEYVICTVFDEEISLRSA